MSLCESSRYRRALSNNDTCIILCTPTPLCKQQPCVLSPSVFLPRRGKNPPPSSEGGEAALCTAVRAQLPRCEMVLCKRCHWSPIQPLSQALLILKGLTAPLTQGSRGSPCKRSAQTLHRRAKVRAQFALCGTGEPRLALNPPLSGRLPPQPARAKFKFSI